MKQIVILFFVVAFLDINAQDKEEVEWASPSVENMTLGKGIVFSYQRASPYDIYSESQLPQLVPDARGDIQRIRRLQFKLRVPVILEKQTQLIVGLEYNTDEFEFKSPEDITFPFYSSLHHRDLRGRGVRFYFNHALDDKKFIFSRVGIDLNGDIPKDWYSVLKYSVSASYGFKKSPTKAWGVGFYFSYNFGRPLFLPAILYNKTWNEHWGIEMLFPGMVMLRYNLNSRNVFYVGYDVQGASYTIDMGNTLNEQFKDLQLRRSELTPHILYEREIYDFIWFSVAGGYRYNINFNVSEDRIFDEKEILVNDVETGFFVTGSIFIIPTESLKNLLKKDN